MCKLNDFENIHFCSQKNLVAMSRMVQQVGELKVFLRVRNRNSFHINPQLPIKNSSISTTSHLSFQSNIPSTICLIKISVLFTDASLSRMFGWNSYVCFKIFSSTSSVIRYVTSLFQIFCFDECGSCSFSWRWLL